MPKKQTPVIKWALYCSACGTDVPFNKQRLVLLMQQKVAPKKFILEIGYECKVCRTVTFSDRHYKKSQRKVLIMIDLYNKKLNKKRQSL